MSTRPAPIVGFDRAEGKSSRLLCPRRRRPPSCRSKRSCAARLRPGAAEFPQPPVRVRTPGCRWSGGSIRSGGGRSGPSGRRDVVSALRMLALKRAGRLRGRLVCLSGLQWWPDRTDRRIPSRGLAYGPCIRRWGIVPRVETYDAFAARRPAPGPTISGGRAAPFPFSPPIRAPRGAGSHRSPSGGCAPLGQAAEGQQARRANRQQADTGGLGCRRR
jgi:hypothetical protein